MVRNASRAEPPTTSYSITARIATIPVSTTYSEIDCPDSSRHDRRVNTAHTSIFTIFVIIHMPSTSSTITTVHTSHPSTVVNMGRMYAGSMK